MQGYSIWVVLTLSWLFCSKCHADQETSLQCDSLDVQDAVALIISAHNKELTEGNQLALYQIIKAAKTQNESVEFLSVIFTARESNCAAGEDKTWQECDYIEDHSKLLRHCQGTLLLKDTNEILKHHCSAEPSIIAEPRPPCLGCPEKIDVESDDIQEPLTYSVAKANSLNEHTHHFLLNSVIAGFRYGLQFDLQKSNCTKENFKDITEECHPDPIEPSFINCNSIVDVAPWRHELPDTSVKCEPGPLLKNFGIRRRPPGWSPLRNINDFAVKQESSEESQESKALNVTPSESQNPSTEPKPSQSPAVLTHGNATSFNCPSKPWKDFNVKADAIPRNPPPPPPQPDNNEPNPGGFLDSDLLDVLGK
ncbi:Kininogen-1 [Bagarius yarrelli]|uniref:Kininogen-1 n=1 Tax=Bagarius yarrelli TaxID=175774 RepID=A0A556TSC9_BAGYA|nr:Kininogen-1 [Bagarius yarrelli]